MKFLLILWVLLGVKPLSVKQDTTVLICKSSTAYAYHSHYCQGLRSCTHNVVRISLEAARNAGKTPCGYCYKKSGRSGQSFSDPAQAGQCQAITKKGTRCSRSSRSNGYCWQHGG